MIALQNYACNMSGPGSTIRVTWNGDVVYGVHRNTKIIYSYSYNFIANNQYYQYTGIISVM